MNLAVDFLHLHGRSNGLGRGAFEAQRPGPLRAELSGMYGWRQPADARMRSDVVVVAPPFLESHAHLHQGGEQRLVQKLVAQPPVEAFDEAVLHGLSRRDVVPFDLGVCRPGQDRVARQFGAVVADDRLGFAAPGNDEIELARHALARQRGVGDGGKAFPGAES